MCNAESLFQVDLSKYLPISTTSARNSGGGGKSSSSPKRLRRGFCLILNQEHFRPADPTLRDFGPRTGTDRDVAELSATFRRFDCEVKVLRELTSEEIKKQFSDLGERGRRVVFFWLKSVSVLCQELISVAWPIRRS